MELPEKYKKITESLNLFGEPVLIRQKTKITNERQLVIQDILELVNGTAGIKRKQTARNVAVYLSPYPTSDLYSLFSKMKLSKTPASLFWYYAKNIPNKYKP